VSLAFSIAAATVSGGSSLIASAVLRGLGPHRLYVKNVGANPFTSAKVEIGPEAANVHDFDTTTFATLAAGAMASLRIEGPIHAINLRAVSASGTTASAWLADDGQEKG